MPDWFDKIISLIKLPIKYLWVASIFTGFIFFAPQGWIEYLGLLNIKTDYKAWLGPLFVLSSALVVLDVLRLLWQKIKSIWLRRKLKFQLIDSLSELDHYEKSIIREFFIQNKKTLQLPMDQATISGMLQNRFLILAGRMGERSLAGTLVPIRINPIVAECITYEHIDLPVNPSDADIERVKNNRPDFLYEIEHHNQLFHTHWNRNGL